MKQKNSPYKFKHIREKNYESSHPLYDAMKSICNPNGENSGHTAEYNGTTFQLYMCKDTYYDVVSVLSMLMRSLRLECYNQTSYIVSSHQRLRGRRHRCPCHHQNLTFTLIGRLRSKSFKLSPLLLYSEE